jgi:cellulose synthase/poly-beta-1,6-N-acetylglucosamine synthase-like glycosyltransferase
MALAHSIVTILLFTGLAGLTGLVIYLWFFALVHFVAGKRATPKAAEPRTRFAFVVPAHNEEAGITDTVTSLLNVCYQRQLFDVVVIADNCTDGTAARAGAAGAECIERHDSTLRGKGYALRHAFTQLLPRGYDAFIVIDADSIVSENFLTPLDMRLRRGEQVIQAFDGLSNPDASILTYLFQVGNLIENTLFWEPKDILGLPIFLRGNGMCFAREILEAHPWDAFSIVEDTEYGLLLTGKGIRIHFAPEIGVYACQPENLQQAFVQRVRWASGNSALTKGRALRLIATGLFRGSISSVDVGLSLIAGSRPLLLLANIVLLGLTVYLGSTAFTCWAGSLFLAQVLYIGLGIAMNGISMQKIVRLVLSPFYLAWICMVSLLGVAGYRKNQWTRTSRS